MRLRSFIVCLLLCVIVASAKDVITKTDGTQIDAKVEEVTESVIKYRKLSNPTGPIYTIPITSVASIKYENGAVDSFTESVKIKPSTPLSDEELMKYAKNHDSDVFSGTMSDHELLRLYDMDSEMSHKIPKYRKIGWIGGSFIFVAGVATCLILFESEDWTVSVPIMCASLVGGAIWCAGFNMKANSIQKQARLFGVYSMPLLEKEFKMAGGNSMTAGINLMGNRLTRNNGVGLSLGFNF